MSLFADPEQHAANPPETWQIVRIPTGSRARFALKISADQPHPETFATRGEAERERDKGYTRRLYEDEARWYAGEPVRGWRPWAEVKADQERNAARHAQIEAQRQAIIAGAAA